MVTAAAEESSLAGVERASETVKKQRSAAAKMAVRNLAMVKLLVNWWG